MNNNPPRSNKTLRLILGDQLDLNHSWFHQIDDSVIYVLAELRQETDYVKHHIQKLCAFFSAMENFANELQDNGHEVVYLNLDDTFHENSIVTLLERLVREFGINTLEYQRPDEYRLMHQLQSMSFNNPIQVNRIESEHFYLSYEELSSWFKPDKHLRMENFYRKMRLKFDVLMNGTVPEGERWNFDQENRQKLKKQDLLEIPQPLLFSNDVSHILERLKRHGVSSIGVECTTLLWPTNRIQAKSLLNHFVTYCLPNFGRFQDAMSGQSDVAWSLYHSRISFALNCKLLSPREVVETAVSHYRESAIIDLAQIEGFVRQIIGWREYVRGVYWINMPQYESMNALQAQLPLPNYFWDAGTKMSCMKDAIGNSLDYSYAHHIHRLMITGNFCLLTGVSPDEVDEWYLGIYIDALQWVELPNTRGMALSADGGIVGTKPYAAGGNYINKMSDYCSGCHYDVKKKSGESSCPFNSLYWNFMIRHREKLQNNQRSRLVYGNWDRMEKTVQESTLRQARHYLNNLNDL